MTKILLALLLALLLASSQAYALDEIDLEISRRQYDYQQQIDPFSRRNIEARQLQKSLRLQEEANDIARKQLKMQEEADFRHQIEAD